MHLLIVTLLEGALKHEAFIIYNKTEKFGRNVNVSVSEMLESEGVKWLLPIDAGVAMATFGRWAREAW